MSDERVMLPRRRHPPGGYLAPLGQKPGGGPSWVLLAREIQGGKVFPADWEHWAFRNDAGWALAYLAAGSDRLPEGFGQWDMRLPNGLTVAHIAAMRGKIPQSAHPSVWRLCNDEGESVWGTALAHNAAPEGGLPPWPDRPLDLDGYEGMWGTRPDLF